MSSVSPTLKDVSDRLANDPSQDDLVAAIEVLANEAEQAREERERLRDENEELRDENERLRDELESVRERTGRELAEVRSRVTDTEEALDADESGEEPVSDGSDPTPETGKTTLHDAVTPLGDCVTLPEPVAEQELTANVKRARDVAADVVDYGRSVPAGYAVTSSELRTVLTAMDEGDGRMYTETVRRVMDYLDELGGDDVAIKETRGGQRTVVFSDEFVRRTVAWRNETASNGVVTETGTTG